MTDDDPFWRPAEGRWDFVVEGDDRTVVDYDYGRHHRDARVEVRGADPAGVLDHITDDGNDLDDPLSGLDAVAEEVRAVDPDRLVGWASERPRPRRPWHRASLTVATDTPGVHADVVPADADGELLLTYYDPGAAFGAGVGRPAGAPSRDPSCVEDRTDAPVSRVRETAHSPADVSALPAPLDEYDPGFVMTESLVYRDREEGPIGPVVGVLGAFPDPDDVAFADTVAWHPWPPDAPVPDGVAVAGADGRGDDGPAALVVRPASGESYPAVDRFAEAVDEAYERSRGPVERLVDGIRESYERVVSGDTVADSRRGLE